MRGFTLLEVVLTTAVLVVIVAVGILSYGSFNRTIDLSTVAGDISAQLRRAQTRAMGADDLKCWGIHFDNTTAGSAFFSLFSDTTCTNATTAYSTDVEKYFLPARVVFTTPADTVTSNVLFQKLTGSSVTNSATSIVIATPDGIRTKTISINSVGTVSY